MTYNIIKNTDFFFYEAAFEATSLSLHTVSVQKCNLAFYLTQQTAAKTHTEINKD